MNSTISTNLGTPGAIESNAGDDYHILWASRRCLALIEAGASLTLVTVEGVSHFDEEAVTDPDAFLAVDLTEYYGGTSLADSQRVEFSQLKYSQRHPDRPWTAARLCEAHRGDGNRSVIARLAQAFSGFCEQNDRLVVIERLRIKLVSNRPIDDGLNDAREAAMNWLSNRDPATRSQAGWLIRGIDEIHRDPIQRLKDSSRLTSTAFCDFLRCLDFSNCNSDSRRWQRLRLIQEVGRVAPASPTEHARDLYELVASEALPRVGPRGLSRADVLAALGCNGEADLFPAPPAFQHIADPIPTPDADHIVQELQSSSSQQLLAHGAGGVGKTTTVLTLQDRWAQARFLLYDSFGQGSYLDSPGDERHSPRRALLQLSNQLAVLCGSPFLIRPPDSVDDLWRQFRNRLEAAASLLKALDESLVLVIDAADNSIRAADTPEDSFIVDLWRVPLPDNVYLLMTARSGGRAQSLQAPEGTPEVELTGFDPNASAQHLRRFLPTASDDETDDFHHRSHGNPRVQSYALQTASATPDIVTVLRHARRQLEDIFQDYVEAALTLRFSHGDPTSHLDDLTCFDRPLRLCHLTEVLGLPATEIEALCGALAPGLQRKGDNWGFLDEDFDTFLNSRLGERQQQEAHSRIAKRMAALPGSDFAARHKAGHLFRASDDEGVIELALEGDSGIPIRDEVARVQVLRRRLALGVKAAARVKRHDALLRLTLHAADAARSDRAILKLIGDHPDLAALYADPQTIARHYLDSENTDWFGGAQLRCAALLSSNEEHHARAREHFKMAQAWLRRWMAKPKEERNQWQVDARDIAAGTEALFRMAGPDDACRWLTTWRPFSAVLKACRWLADAIAPEIPAAQQAELYRTIRPHPLAAVLFLVAFHRHGEAPGKDLVEEVLRRVEGYYRLRHHSQLPTHRSDYDDGDDIRTPLGTDFAELLAAYGIESDRIATLLKLINPVEPHFPPHDSFSAQHFAPQLRTLALLAELSGNEPDPAELEHLLLKHHETSDDRSQEEARRRFRDLIVPRFDLYRLRAEALVRKPAAKDLLPRLTKVVRKGGEEPWRYHGKFDFFFRDAIPLVTDAVLACQGDIEEFLDLLTEGIARKFGIGAPSHWVNLAERVIAHPAHTRRALLLLDRVAAHLHEHPTDGQEHCDVLLRCAALARRYDTDQGAGLFRQAVVVARELNDDLSDRLEYLAQTAEALRGELNEEESRDLAARLARLTEETRIYVTNDERYPWPTVLRVVTALHAASGYALLTRWSDLDHIGVRSHVDDLALAGLTYGSLSPLQAMAILRFGHNGRATATAFLPILTAARGQGGTPSAIFKGLLERISHWILRDISREARPESARKVQEWLIGQDCGDLPNGKPLREYMAFLAAHPREDDRFANLEMSTPEAHPREQVDWNRLFGDRPIPDRLPQLRQELYQLRDGYFQQEEFFRQARKRLRPSERTAYLQALLELPGERVVMGDYLSEWEACLNAWRHSGEITEWAETGMAELARRHLPGILGYQFTADQSLERLLRLPFVKPAQWSALLAPALADWVERLEAWQLYRIADVLARDLAVNQRKALLQEAIERGEAVIEERRNAPLPQLPAWALYGSDRDTPLALLLHTLLGDPDTRIRWSCLHALREMQLQSAPGLLAALIERLDACEADGFLPSDSPFLWMSARAYLMVYVVRLAWEHPAALLPHVETLLRHAHSTDFPHAQIRELAKRALLVLDKRMPGALSPEVRQQLERSNVPRDVVTDKIGLRGWADTRSHEGRFHFDEIDTLPYWYAPLGRLFGLNASAVATRAEEWICDQWGVFDYEARKGQRRRLRERDWQLVSHSHGSLPVIEERQRYLEYHAMHLVAGALVDSRPLVNEYPDWESDPWGNWLRCHLPTLAGDWLSDLRDPTPMEPQLQGSSAPPLSSWLPPKLPDEFDACLGLSPSGIPEYLIVGASVDLYANDRRERQRVESALVSPRTAHALLRALQSVGDPHAYRIPPAGDDLESDEPSFSLKGWIGFRSGETELDGNDPLLNSMDTALPYFPQSVSDALRMQAEPSGKCYRDRQHPDVIIAEIDTWSDRPENDSYHSEFSSGWRFRVEIDRLLRYLREQERCLILEVQLDRKERRYGREDYDDKPPPPLVLLYLLHSDGRLETLEHYRHLRREDR